MADFATLSDVAAFLQIAITTPTQIAAVNRALTEASETVRNYCHQLIDLVEDDEITLDCVGGVRLFLPELPVTEVSEVIEDGETLVIDDDYKLGQHGILHRVGQKWVKGIQIVTITYSHGYATIPDDIIAVTVRAASRAYQSGLRAADADGVLGVQSKSLGDFSVAYGAEGGAEGVMGASAARMLLMSEQDILNRYRI